MSSLKPRIIKLEDTKKLHTLPAIKLVKKAPKRKTEQPVPGKLEFRTYADLIKLITSNLHRIPRDIDCVVGIPRSGLMVASLIALHINKPVTDIYSFAQGRAAKTGKYRYAHAKQYNKVLVVDDAIGGGSEIKAAKKMMGSAKAVYLVAYTPAIKKDLADINLEICDPPRAFAWNILHHDKRRVSWDMDGVICLDPPKGVDHPKPEYKKFLANAKPKILPAFSCEAIITGRLDIYRKETEAWLKKHGVTYQRLIMKPLTVRGVKNTPTYKAEHYKALPSDIYIESHAWQAQEIALKSGKHVYCVGNHVFYEGGTK